MLTQMTDEDWETVLTVFDAHWLPEPAFGGRGAEAEKASFALHDRGRCAVAETSRQRVEMQTALIGRDAGHEVEQHGVQRPLPWLRTRGIDQRCSAQLGIAGMATRPRIDDTAGERCDHAAARPASIEQAAAMVDTNHCMGEPPSSPEMRSRARLQAAWAILQQRPRPTQSIGFFSVQQESAVGQQRILREAAGVS